MRLGRASVSASAIQLPIGATDLRPTAHVSCADESPIAWASAFVIRLLSPPSTRMCARWHSLIQHAVTHTLGDGLATCEALFEGVVMSDLALAVFPTEPDELTVDVAIEV